MTNAARAHFDAIASENKANNRRESGNISRLIAHPKTGKMVTLVQRTSTWAEPKKRHVPDLVDWIADNPDFKKSRAYNRLMDAYYESLQHSCR